MSETILLEYKYVISGTIKNLKFFSDLAIFRPKSSGPSGLKKWPGSISSQEAELPQWPGSLFDRTLMDLSKATNLIAIALNPVEIWIQATQATPSKGTYLDPSATGIDRNHVAWGCIRKFVKSSIQQAGVRFWIPSLREVLKPGH